METKKDYSIEIQIYTEVLHRLMKHFENNYYRGGICRILKLIHFNYIDNNINCKLSRIAIKQYMINHKPVNVDIDWFWFPRNKKGLQSRIVLVRKVIKDLEKL